MSYLVLDTETTGIDPEHNELLQLAVIDHTGRVLLDTYIRPVRRTSWPDAQRIHGITPEFIFSDRPDGLHPTWEEVRPRLFEICRGREVVIYSASFDLQYVGEALAESTVHCAMLRFAQHYGDWNEYYESYRWQKLSTAADHVLHEWQGRQHTALADALAALSVWKYLEDPDLQAKVKQAKEQRAREQEERWEVDYHLNNMQHREGERLREHARRKTQELFDRLGLPFNADADWRGTNVYTRHRVEKSAQESAEVFCKSVTGWELNLWRKYGELLLGTIYEKDLPERFQEPAEKVHWIKQPAPAAVRKIETKRYIEYQPLYDWSQMELGREWVPILKDYPDNCYSQSRLKKEFKLKDAQIAKLRKVGLRRTKYLDYYLFHYIPQSVTKEAEA